MVLTHNLFIVCNKLSVEHSKLLEDPLPQYTYLYIKDIIAYVDRVGYAINSAKFRQSLMYGPLLGHYHSSEFDGMKMRTSLVWQRTYTSCAIELTYNLNSIVQIRPENGF